MRSGEYKVRYIPHLRGGLNDFDDSSEISNNEMSDCENVEVNDKTIRSAAGYVDYGGSAVDGPYWGGFHAVFSSGTNRLIRQRGTTLEYDNGSGTWTNCTLPTTGSPSATVVLTQIPCSMEMLNDIVLWSNGTDTVMSSTDGITWTLRASLPKSKQLFNNGLNRIVFSGQTTSPSRVDWSDINDPLTINAASYQFIGKNDGQSIERFTLTPIGGMLCNKTGRFYSISDITEGMIAVDPIGEAPCYGGTVVATENSIIWFGGDAIYEYSGRSVKIISGNISFASRANISSAYLATATYYNKKYRLSIPSADGTYNFHEYVVDRKQPTGKPDNPYVITRNGRNIGCYIVEKRDVSNVRRNRLYIGSSLSGASYRMFSYLNELHDSSITQGLNGSAQFCYFITKFFNEEDPYLLKRYIKYFFDTFITNQFDVTVSYRFSQDGPWTDVINTIQTDSLDIEYEDGNSGTFFEGYSFATTGTRQVFIDLETGENITGIQFRLSWSSINDVTILNQAYKFLENKQFH